jgi:outer membrane usher protein
LAYDLRTKAINIHASSQRTFGSYDDLGSVTSNGPLSHGLNGRPPKALDLISIGTSLGLDASQIQVSYLHQELGGGSNTSRITGSYSRPILDGGFIHVSAFSDVDGGSNYGMFFGLSMQLGETLADESPIWVSTGVDTSGSGINAIVDASKSVQPEADSLGWRLHIAEGKSPIRSATVSYRSSFAEIGGSIQQYGRNIDLALQASGAVAVLGGGTFFSNRIDDAFAVVDAGAAGVHVLRENRVVGATDAQGLLLIPHLESYNLNNISIDVRDLPINAGVPTIQRTITPQARSGVFVDFGVETDGTAAVVILRDSAGEFIAPGSVEGYNEPFVVGYDGRTFLQGLQAVNTVVVVDTGGECRATFPFAADQSAQVVIGPLTCQ